MKLNKNFITHNMDDESLLVPMSKAGFSGMVKGNSMLGEVLALLKSETTEEQVAQALRKKYQAPDGVIEKDVSRVVSQLRSIGAIDE